MAEPAEYANQQELAALAELRELHRQRARVDAGAFAAFALKDEETGLPVRMEPAHYEWHQLCDNHRRVVIWGAIESGKSQQLSVARVVWELGRNPELRILVLSNTDGQAQKITGLIARYIERDADVHSVFPELKPAKREGWTKHTIVVARGGMQKDPSVQSAGIHANIMGSRIDLLVVDDILDHENSQSEHQRNDLDAWLRSTVNGRLTRKARVIATGNPWHVQDQLHRWARLSKVWLAVRYPAVGPSGEQLSSRWPPERVAAFEAESGPIETARQLRCVARDDASSHFKESWVNRCLDRGMGRELIYGLETVPHGYECYTGVDLSTGKAHGHRTSMFTILVHPNEDRELLDIEAGRWEGPEIVDRLIDVHHRFGGRVIVENNAAQEYILQFTRGSSAVPVEPYTTNKQAFRNPAFGVESLGAEMANGKWIIPCGPGRVVDPEVKQWIQECLDYDPNKHPGDTLMASFFAREGARRRKLKGRVGNLSLSRR